MLKLIAGFLIVLCLGQALHATTWNVDASSGSSGDGSASKPFKTISNAAEMAQPGDTVIVHRGTYREDVRIRRSGTAAAPIRFEAQPMGSAIVTGADVMTGWQRVDGAEPIYRVAWPYVFAIDHDSHGRPIEFHPDDAPLWGRAEQVVADDKQLLPCPDLNDLRAAYHDRAKRLTPPVKNIGGPFVGMFAADTIHHVLYLWLSDGSDPNSPKHTIQASTRSQIFGVNEYESAQGVHDVQVSGFIFRYAANFPQRAGVVLHGQNNLIEHCIIQDMSQTGVDLNGTLRQCLIRNNGHIGGGAERDGCVNEQCLWEGNSWKPINRMWEAGGTKACDSHRGRFDQCLFYHNGGPGLWFDIDCRDITVHDCAFVENELSGLFIEISQNITADGNYMARNAVGIVGTVGNGAWSCGGIQIGESMGCTIQNNVCLDNKDGIAFREIGPRPIKTRDGQTVIYHISNDHITHNTIANSRGYQLAFWWDNNFFGPHPSSGLTYSSHEQWVRHLAATGQGVYDPLRQNLQIDDNIYAGNSSFLYGVPWRIESKKLPSLADFTKLTGFEKNGQASFKELGADAEIENRIDGFDPFRP